MESLTEIIVEQAAQIMELRKKTKILESILMEYRRKEDEHVKASSPAGESQGG